MQTLSLSDHKVYNYSDLSRSFIQNGLPNHQEEESAIKREWLLVYGQSSSLELPPPVPTHQLQLLRTPRKSGSHCLVSSAARAWPKNADPSGGPPQAMEPQIQCALQIQRRSTEQTSNPGPARRAWDLQLTIVSRKWFESIRSDLSCFFKWISMAYLCQWASLFKTCWCTLVDRISE